MNFHFGEEQEAISELAEQIFSGSSPVDRVTEIEAGDERFDRDLWAQLAEANMLGVAIPEAYGGLGFGTVELALVLQQQGRRVAPVPLLATLAMGALPIAEFGSDELRSRWLPGVVSGDVVLTAALQEPGSNDPLHPGVVATPVDGGWSLSGEKVAVPAAELAERILVPAATPSGVGVFVVDPGAEGVTVELSETTNRERHGIVTLAGASVATDQVLGDPSGGAAIVEWLVERTQVAMAAIVLGCCEEAIRMAAEHTSTREQFGRPLSTNQGVALRMADCYIDTECIRVSLWQAAWRIDAGLPATDEITVAKWWSAEMGQRVVHNIQHVHGGTGSDVDYPVHRYFLWVKQLENTLGGGSPQLAKLGASLAAKAKSATTAP